jgi:DNA-binding NarL/FixJ family response regulator
MSVKQPMGNRMKNKLSPAPIKVFIVDDHPVFRKGLVQIVNGEEDMAVCGQAGDAEQALQAIPRLQPDLVLVDISLPGKNGLQMIKEIRAVNQQIKLLVVSMHDEALYVNRMLRAGGDGYIMKQEDPEEIIHAIRDVMDGHIYLSENVMASRPGAAVKRQIRAKNRPLDLLADTELEILEMLGLGKDNREISRHLRLPIVKVVGHVAQIKYKLNLETDDSLLRYARAWVENDI